MEGGRRVSAKEFKRFFPLSTSRFPQQKRVALAADGVREVGYSPDFSVRYGRAEAIMVYSVKRKIIKVIAGTILLIVILLSVVGWSYGILQVNVAGAYNQGILVKKNPKKAFE